MGINVLGLDIGGTEIKGGIVNADGTIQAVRTIATNAREGKDHILQQLYTIIQQLTDHCPVQAIGVGSAGRINVDEGKVVYATSNLPGWHGLELGRTLDKRFGLPVIIDNDVNAAALGEAWQGSAAHANSAFFLSLGTGVGGGLLYKGELIRGTHWSAGEIGHMVLYPNGLPCNCGRRGCTEQYISGTAFVSRAEQATNKTYAHGSEVFADYNSGDPILEQVITGFVKDLATVAANIQTIYDPDMIVIGGGVPASRQHWLAAFQRELSTLPFPISIEWAQLVNKAGFIGAAKLAIDLVLESPRDRREST